MSRRQHPNEDPRPAGKKGSGLTAKMSYGNTGKGEGQASWGGVSPVALTALIDAVTDTGAAILLGYSRDRGAYRVLIMDDDGKLPVWIPCTTDVEQALEDLTQQVWTSSRE